MSLPAFLVEEGVIEEDGVGEALELGAVSGLVALTLGVREVVEQESLEVAVHGSADGAKWSEKPVAWFPQKFYVGTSTVLWDPARWPEVRYLQARWKCARWGRGSLKPRFRLYVFAAALGEV